METVHTNEGTEKESGKLIKINEEEVKSHLNQLVLKSVEETLNGLLDAEADSLLGAERYERAADRQGTRAGHYTRGLHTTAGEVSLKVPKLRELKFETQIIERYRRKEASVEESLVEMYLAGVSVRRVEDITQALWGTRVSPSTVSDLNQKIYGRIEAWRKRPIEGKHPYVFVDGIWLKRSWGGEVKNIAVLVAMAVNEEGYREILGVCEGSKEDKESWLGFLRHLKERGLKAVQMVTSDKCLGLVESLGEVYPEVAWQRCIVHFYRNVMTVTPKGKVKEVMKLLKAVHAQESKEAAQEKIQSIAGQLKTMKLHQAAKLVEEGMEETLAYYQFPCEHWTRIRTNNPLERINREIRRRSRVVGAFPDGNAALMLVAARLRHISGTKWGSRKYLDMSLLVQPREEEVSA